MEKLKNLTDFLNVVISREEIETGNLEQSLRTLNQLLLDKETISHFFERVDIGFSGYDDDPRELWDIPEVKQFVQNLDCKFPYWFYFLSKFGSGLKVITFCYVNLIKISGTQVSIDEVSLAKYYNIHFSAMNRLGDSIQMTEKENAELSESVFSYFS
jgi:hypothetical protein